MFLLTFFIIFGPLLDIGLGLFSDLIIVLSLFLSMYVLVYKKRKVDKEIKNYIYIFLAIFIYSIVSFLIFGLGHTEENIRVLLRPIRLVITFLGVYSLVLLYIEKYSLDYINKILYHSYYAISLHGIIMVYQFINPDFRNFIYSFTMAKYVLAGNQEYRMAGLSGGGGAMIAVFESMGLLILPFILKIERSFLKKIILIILGVFIIVSIILSGRSGLFAFALFLPVIGVYFFIQSSVLKKAKSMIIFLLATISIIFTFVWVYQNMINDMDPYAKRAFDRTFESFISYGETGETNDRTVSALQNMLLLPENPVQFLFGELHYLGGFRGVQSDIGYIRYLYGYGFLGSLLNYMFYAYAIVFLYKKRKVYKDFSFLAGLLLFVIMFFQMKEIFVFTKTGFSITSIILISFILYEKISKRRNINEIYYSNYK